MPIPCPLCDKLCADERGLVFHVLSARHDYGRELRARIDWLNANLAEAERAIAIYRELARERAP